jgi:hypothetical protein
MYAPYKNTFEAQLRCSQSGDPCSSNQQCRPNCEQPERHNPMFCLGSPYLKERNMGTCYQRWARQGDACIVPVLPNAQRCTAVLSANTGCGLTAQQRTLVRGAVRR